MLRRFGADRRGLAAIEFALAAPIAVLLYCGFAELTMAAHAASVVADLVSQSTQVSATDVSDIFTSANAIMNPFPSAPLKLRVTSVVADANGIPRVAWSQGQGMGALTGGVAVSSFPPNLLVAGDSVIMADVQYAFTSPLQMTLPSPVTYSNTFYLKPRRSTSVALN
jgi:Flp pilus assembly protein TadG